MLAHRPLPSLAYPIITYTPLDLVADNFPIKLWLLGNGQQIMIYIECVCIVMIQTMIHGRNDALKHFIFARHVRQREFFKYFARYVRREFFARHCPAERYFARYVQQREFF